MAKQKVVHSDNTTVVMPEANAQTAPTNPENGTAQAPTTQQPRSEVVVKPLQEIDRHIDYYGCQISKLTIDTPATEWPTSLDRNIPEQRAAIFNALNPADVTVPTGGTVTFTAVHWLMMVDEREDEDTGELRTFAVLVLYDKSGTILKTTSKFAPQKLKAALALYSPTDWINGITFVIRDRPSKKPGRHSHDVRIVPNRA